MSNPNYIMIAGAGGIGRAVGLILAENPSFEAEIHIGDLYTETAVEAADWINEGCKAKVAHPFTMPREGSDSAMDTVLKKCEIILDCLPGSQAPRMARFADQHDLHYANLTEYVKETNEVVEIAKQSKKGFVLQTGLAPGFINILGHQLFQRFTTQYGVEKADRLEMKVGALTRHAQAPHFYGFTWSPVGVATEYLKDCIAVRNHEKVMLPPLSEKKTLIIDGITYEENLTSGGAADLPDAFAGKIKDLDYKTLRYPGHYDWVRKILSEEPVGKNAIEYLQEVMQTEIPSVEDDVVIVYAAIEGKDKHGVLRGIQASYKIEPTYVGTKRLRAIQTTTAAPLAEVARMLLTNKWSGPVFQSQLDVEAFMNGPFVSPIYGTAR